MSGQCEDGRRGNRHWIETRDERLHQDLSLSWLWLLDRIDESVLPACFLNEDSFHLVFLVILRGCGVVLEGMPRGKDEQ